MSFVDEVARLQVSEDAQVLLVPLSEQHVPDLQRVASDGELWNLRFTSVPRPEDCLRYVRQALGPHEYGHQAPFVVIDRQTGQVVGTTRYYGAKESPRRVYIGYTFYQQSAQRTHVNTASKLELLRHAFDVCGAQVVAWETDITNLRSQAAIERLGAHRDGILRCHMVRRDGTIRDTVVYSLLAEEWPQTRTHLLERLTRGSEPPSPTKPTV